jgi:hypothetical protein
MLSYTAQFSEALERLAGRKVIAVFPLVVGVELVFDGDYRGNLVTVYLDGSFQIGSVDIEALAEHDPYYAVVWDRVNAIQPAGPVDEFDADGLLHS